MRLSLTQFEYFFELASKKSSDLTHLSAVLKHHNIKETYERPPKPRGAGILFTVVPVVGLEPTRCHHRGILNPLRLPFRHTGITQ